MARIMMDLETLGTRAGCVILSIGACTFDENTGEIGNEFYQVINTQSCKDIGLRSDKLTEQWWMSQSREAQKVLVQAESNQLGDNVGIKLALAMFNEYLSGLNMNGTANKLYGNGSDFDNAIIIAAYGAANLTMMFGNYSNRCYRTLKDLTPHIGVNRGGVYHHALDDAKTQAEHAIRILRFLNDACANQLLKEIPVS